MKLRHWIRGFVLLVCLFPVNSADAWPMDPIGRRLVLYPEDLEQAGVMRLADILRLAEDWRLSSIDGFTVYGAAGGREEFGDQSWTVFVDGQPVELEVLGNLAINRLPLSPDAIDSVEFLGGAVFAGGALHERGIIRIELRSEERGPWGSLRTAWGQETGDPGPYRYLGDETPNVEHLGPDWFLDGGWTLSRGGFGAGVADLHHGWTDPNLYDRLVVFGTDDLIERALLGANARGHWRALGGTHRLHLSASRLEEFFYYSPFGREYPSQTDLVQLGLSGTISLPGALALRYGLRGSQNNLGEFENSLDFRFDYRIRRGHGFLHLERQRDSSTLLLGLGQRSLKGDWDLGEQNWQLLELSAAYEWRHGTTLRQQTALQLVFMDGETSPRLSVAGEWRPVPNQRLSAVANFVSRYRAELPSAWPWIQAGYPLHPEYEDRDDKDRDQRSALELRWETLLPRGLGLDVDLFWRRIANKQWAQQEYMPQAGTAPYSEQALLRGNIGGDEAGGAAALHGKLGARASFRVSYSYTAPTAGDEDYRQIWDTVPDHRLRAVLGMSPRPSFRMSAVLDHRSRSLWANWRANPDPAVSQPVTAELSPFTTLDLILRKDVWRNQLRLRFIFRNLLGADNQTHPIGSREDFSFFVSLQLRLPGNPTP